MVFNLSVLEAEFYPQDTLKVELSIKFRGVDFSNFEKSSGTDGLINPDENFKKTQISSNRPPVMSNYEKPLIRGHKRFS